MRPPQSNEHALTIGMIVGAVGAQTARLPGGVGVEILDDDDGNHLDTFRVRFDHGDYLVTVIPEV